MPYLNPGTPIMLIDRAAALATDGNPGWYFPSIPINFDTGEALTVSIGGVTYWFIWMSSDHGSDVLPSTGIYLYLCPVSVGAAGVINPANWIAIDLVLAAGILNPVFRNTSGAGTQPETPDVHFRNSRWILFGHSNNVAATQRTFRYDSADMLTWVNPSVPLPGTTSATKVSHDGYFKCRPNSLRGETLFRGLPYKDIGQSLRTWPAETGGEDGQFVNTQLVGSNDGMLAVWNLIRRDCLPYAPRDFYSVTDGTRQTRIETGLSFFERVGDKILGLSAFVSPASGDEDRQSSLYEMLYNQNFDPVSEPRLILGRGGVGYENEVGQTGFVRFNGEPFFYFVGVDDATPRVNRLFIVPLTIDLTARAPRSWPIVNDEIKHDFTVETTLPEEWTPQTGTTYSFNPGTTGVSITTTAGVSTRKAFMKLDDLFKPSDLDIVEIFLDGYTTNNNSAIICLFGFVNDYDTLGLSMDEFADATTFIQVYNAGNGGARMGYRVAGVAGPTVYTNADQNPSNFDVHAMGNTTLNGGDQQKLIGIRWWPHRKIIAFVGENYRNAVKHNLTLFPDIDDLYVPALSVLSVGADQQSVHLLKSRVRYGGVEETRQDIVLAPALSGSFGIQPIVTGV